MFSGRRTYYYVPAMVLLFYNHGLQHIIYIVTYTWPTLFKVDLIHSKSMMTKASKYHTSLVFVYDEYGVHGLHRSFSGHDGEGQLLRCHKPQEDPR